MNALTPRLRFPSPALIVSCLALFAALGGGAYAATSLSHSSLAWHPAAMTNGWGAADLSYYPAGGYAKDSNGVVHLRGGIADGSSGAAAFRLPVGYRPSHYLYLPIYTDSDTEGSLEITPQGYVKPYGTDVNSYTSLDGVSFAAGE